MLTNTEKETDMSKATEWAKGKSIQTHHVNTVDEQLRDLDGVSVEQDWHCGNTAYEFDDGSAVVVSGSGWDVRAEGCKQTCWDGVGCNCGKTVTGWAIDHGYHEIETDTSDEFVAWQSMDSEDENGAPVTAFCGVKAWRDPSPTPPQYRFVAILRWENGETYGHTGYGRTMLEALQDL
jgi:hypothetical protein